MLRSSAIASHTRSLFLSVGSLVLATTVLGCSKTEKAGADAGAPQTSGVDAAAVGTQGGALLDGGRSRDGGAARGKALSPQQRRTLMKALDDGRKKSRVKDYKGALADFDRALAISPNDGRVLAEVGYAALLDGNLARADAANKRALATVHDKNQRAQILYNSGRVAEEKKDRDAARAAYAASLALRENAEVRRRLEGAGGGAPAPLPCSDGAPTLEALCTCLVGRPDELGLALDTDEKPVCGATPTSLALGTPRLSVVRVGGDDARERPYLLAARDHGKLRPVAELGRDFEPGAFGVHNEATIEGGALRTIGKRSVIVVTSHQSNVDMNLAGLEACTEAEERETVCALGDDKGNRATRCVMVAVATEEGCGPGVEPDDLDPEEKAMVDERKAGWGKSTEKRTWSLEDDGSLVVRDSAGKTVKYALF